MKADLEKYKALSERYESEKSDLMQLYERWLNLIYFIEIEHYGKESFNFLNNKKSRLKLIILMQSRNLSKHCSICKEQEILKKMKWKII
jgi:hypothetical protein